MTAGRLWWILRRDFDRGISATWGDYVLGRRIWQWRNPHASSPTAEVSVHLLCGAEQTRLAAWMIASWIGQTRRNWRFVVHDDGTLRQEDVVRLASMGLTLRTIKRAEADAYIAKRLAAHPEAAKYRGKHPLALKIFDVPLYAERRRFILLDTDVLFFAPPREMLQWVERQEDTSCWFNADCADASNITAEFAQKNLGLSLWPRVNSGICLLDRHVFDLDFCEKVLRETPIFFGHIWRVEQTLFALCASRAGRGGLLPPTYAVTLARDMHPGSVARHYVGAVRDRFWAEGVPAAQSGLGL